MLSTYLAFKFVSSLSVCSAVSVCSSMVLGSFHSKPLEDRDPSVCMALRDRLREMHKNNSVVQSREILRTMDSSSLIALCGS